jgi:hypothetical protein
VYEAAVKLVLRSVEEVELELVDCSIKFDLYLEMYGVEVNLDTSEVVLDDRKKAGNGRHGESKSNLSFELVINSIIEKSTSVRKRTISMLLLRENIEANPGPTMEK